MARHRAKKSKPRKRKKRPAKRRKFASSWHRYASEVAARNRRRDIKEYGSIANARAARRAESRARADADIAAGGFQFGNVWVPVDSQGRWGQP